MARGKAKGEGKVKEIIGTAGFTEVEDPHSKLISAIDEHESCTPVRKDWCWRLRVRYPVTVEFNAPTLLDSVQKQIQALVLIMHPSQIIFP